MISSVTNEIMMSMVITKLRNTGHAKPFGTPLARDSVICTAAISMNDTSSKTSHGLFEVMTNSMMKPIAHSCNSARQADHSNVLPTPMRMISEMPAAMATMIKAVTKPQISME